MTVTINLISYENTGSSIGKCEAQGTWWCDWEDRIDARAQILHAPDPFDSSLACEKVSFKPKDGDWACGKAELAATFVSHQMIAQKDPTAAFKWRLDYSNEAFTISSKGWKWASGAEIKNTDIKPVKELSFTDIVLYGSRTAISLATYDTYDDHINSDVFLGAAIGTVLFKTATAQPRPLSDGSEVVDVEVRLRRRSIPWNQLWNEDTAAWEEIVKTVGGGKVYGSTAFAPLLAAP
jgi:hypothetical protein